MRYMILLKSTPETEATALLPGNPFTSLNEFHHTLARAGVLLDASALQPSARGWRIRYDGQHSSMQKGPFAHPGDLVAGYTLIQVRSQEEALVWSRRFPGPVGDGSSAEIEVRPLYDATDFGADGSLAGSAAIQSPKP